MDASDGSDIRDFTKFSFSSSPAISEFSESQSILRDAQNVISEQIIHGSVDRGGADLFDISDVRSVADVDSMENSFYLNHLQL